MHTGTKDRAAQAVVDVKLQSGICAGTTVMTLDGEIPVEHLSAGDRVITRDSGMAVLRKITVETARFAPIRIKAGSLGHTRPDRDMLVAPGTRLHIRDWRAEALFGASAIAVEAKRLLDGEYLAEQDVRDVTVYTLTFDKEHIVYADGVEMLTNG